MEFELDDERGKKAYEQMLKFLDFSARSEKELRQKLYEKGYHRNEVDFAIEKGKKYNFVNDSDFSRSFIRSNKSKYGSSKIIYRLTEELGVDSSVVMEQILELYPPEDEYDNCMSFAIKYINKAKKPNNLKQKLSAHLYSKGFSYSVINSVVSDMEPSCFNINEEFAD